MDLFDVIKKWLEEKNLECSFLRIHSEVNYLGEIYIYQIHKAFYIHIYYDHITVGNIGGGYQTLYVSDPEFFDKLEEHIFKYGFI